ncbi:MAG: DUF817 family protein [Armatimonadetes bacterium]|nr:DUF817 family protein [Armatimonadota bacterium]
MREFLTFFVKQVQASVFALFIFSMLAVSQWQHVVPRYDFMLAACLAMQVYMVWSKLETKKELVAVTAFHGVGLALELYKVRHGSWTYPEFAYTKFSGVPLYSGFMYASVASYVFQAYRVFGLEFTRMPRKAWALLGVGLIYINFFTAKTFGDNRIWIILALLAMFLPSQAHFTCREGRFRMPMPVAFGLIGFFVWVGENLCTYLGAWLYPHQMDGWELVGATKIVSWSMMVMVAFVLIWTWKERGEEREALVAG